jgi:ABC-type Fe3+-hydroxamate transport system substrate-binding protein
MTRFNPPLGRRAALALGLAAPFAVPAHAAQSATGPITDALGRTVALKSPAERIVLGFNYEEFTAIAGTAGWDRVVGFSRTLWSDWRPAAFTRYSRHPTPRRPARCRQH